MLSIPIRELKSCQSKWISENSLWQVDINIKRCTACDVGLCRLKIILKQGKIAFQKLCAVLKHTVSQLIISTFQKTAVIAFMFG